MTTEQHPLEVYRRFQSYLLNGEVARVGEVADVDGYTENCVGLTGWTAGCRPRCGTSRRTSPPG